MMASNCGYFFRCAVILSAAVLWHTTPLFAQTPAAETPSAANSPVAQFACEDDWSSGNLTCKTGFCGKGGLPKVCSNTGEYKNPKDPNDPKNGMPTCVCVAPTPTPTPVAVAPVVVNKKEPCEKRQQCGGPCERINWRGGIVGAAFQDKADGTCEGEPGKKCKCNTGQLREAARGAAESTVNQGLRQAIPSVIPSIFPG
jgi:hypothetical protein